MHINGGRWAAAFLASEPDYAEFDWLDACAMAFSHCRPELTPDQVAQAAQDAYVRDSWCNPKVAAGMDAVFGPMPTP